MSDYTPYQIEAVNRAITDHDYPRLTCFDHDGICCPCGEFHDKTREEWATHRAEAVLAAAGVTQPEPEYEYAMEDDLGMSFAKDRRDAERHASFQSKEYHPRVVRRVKAGDWEPVPNQEEQS